MKGTIINFDQQRIIDTKLDGLTLRFFEGEELFNINNRIIIYENCNSRVNTSRYDDDVVITGSNGHSKATSMRVVTGARAFKVKEIECFKLKIYSNMRL
jgi:ABC-type transport system involved in cytochrome c biogenesis ATPase subunit